MVHVPITLDRLRPESNAAKQAAVMSIGEAVFDAAERCLQKRERNRT